AEVAEARAAFERPAARRLFADGEQALRLDEVAALLASNALVVDACRRGLGAGDAWLPLARRPILFTLARTLAEAWPADVDREALIASAFRTHRPDETHRARLRVEIGRLRALATTLAGIEAT
ncbi:helix-turn-helix domain-containing protein, partial [Variovorax sp. Varisp62]